MSIRRPVAALTILLLLTGCGSGMKGCMLALDTPAMKPPKVATKSKPIESSLPSTGDDLGAAPHGFLKDAGQKIGEDGVKKLIEDGAKPRDNDKKRDNDRRN